MSEKDDIFENLFKDNLQNIELPVSDGLLVRINKTLFKRKKRRLFFWLILCIGLGGIMGGLLFNIVNNNKSASNKIVAINTNALKNKANKKTVNNTASKVRDSSTQNTSANSDLKNNSTKQQKNKSKLKNISPKKITLNNPNKSKLNDSISKILITNKSLLLNNRANKKESETTSKNKFVSKHTNTNKLISENELVHNKKFDTTLVEKVITINDNSKNDTSFTKKTFNTMSIDTSKHDTIIIKKDSLKIVQFKSINTPAIEAKEDSIKNKIKIFIGIEGGTILNLKKYSEINSNLNESKKPKYTFGYNLLLNFGFVKKKFSFGTGIGFSSIKSNYSYSMLDTVHETITLYDSFGNPYSVDSTYNAVKSLSINFNYNYFHLPLFIEYEVLHTNKINIKPFFGVQLNYLYSAQTSILDTVAKKTVNYDTPNFKAITIAFTGGLKVEYQLSNKWSLYLNPSYFMFLNNIVDDRSKKINPKAINVNFGLRYYFK